MKLGLIGFGNIGKGVEELVFKQREAIKNRFGARLAYAYFELHLIWYFYV